MTLNIRDLKVYVPAKHFEQSQSFYRSLGFAMTEGWGGTADFELDGQHFRLQDHYVREWADNFMMVISVDDVEAWHRRAEDVIRTGAFEAARLTPPELVGDSTVLHVWDPCGVLLIFVQ